jgi:N6-L-threonylcarbamoyladenine synthase
LIFSNFSLLNSTPIILAIESSCDDTAAAVMQGRKVLSNLVANQLVHEKYGGVVPELASRAHQKNIVPVVQEALRQANVKPLDLDAIAFTSGPGLMGSLLVGGAFAKSLALGLNLPLLAVHHMQAHILAHFIDDGVQTAPEFPFLCLTVSGGHTQLVRVSDAQTFEVLGQTLDDAAGEAFDKLAKMLGLPYPGGPVVDQLAKTGNPHAFAFAKPAISGLDFSFSGLKTSFLYFLQKAVQQDPEFVANNLNHICASGQAAIVQVLMDKLQKAVAATGIQRIAIAGGVSANSGLRSALSDAATKNGWQIHIPPVAYTTDNAAMIGIAGYFQYLRSDYAALDVKIEARKPSL